MNIHPKMGYYKNKNIILLYLFLFIYKNQLLLIGSQEISYWIYVYKNMMSMTGLYNSYTNSRFLILSINLYLVGKCVRVDILF